MTTKDPRMLWCEQHVDVLKDYPHHFIAVHHEYGIVCMDIDPHELRNKINELTDDVRKFILITNTDNYV